MGLDGLEDRVFDAVLFDMDGTLVDSTASVYRAWAAWAVEHGVPEAQMRGHDGIPAASIVAKFLPEDERAAGLLRINELELDDTDGLLVLPGAAEALAALVDAPNAIATSCTMPLALARIASSGLVAPTVLVTADQTAHGKPAPDPYLLAAERLGVDPTRCLVVEDGSSTHSRESVMLASSRLQETVPAVGSTQSSTERRRSARVSEPLPLVIRGSDLLGQPFEERTSTLNFNLHGCRYSSKHHLPKNTWLTIETPKDSAHRNVRARVAWIQRPHSVGKLFRLPWSLKARRTFGDSILRRRIGPRKCRHTSGRQRHGARADRNPRRGGDKLRRHSGEARLVYGKTNDRY